MAVHTLDDIVRIYVRNALQPDNVTYQIGNMPVEELSSHELTEDEAGMRTLIMLDNSLSIPQKLRPAISEAIDAIVDSHCEGELFRIATFSDNIKYLSDRYSDDYTAIHNMVSNIQYYDQDTMLTDVLYGVIGELNKEFDSGVYSGYNRIIIITDGVNDKPVGGVTLERVIEELKKTPYPIYTIGCDTGKNGDLLDNLFSLSWQTGCEYINSIDTELSEIIAMTSADNDILVFEAKVPIEAQKGGRSSSKLTLGDGTELVFDVTVPFSSTTPIPEVTVEPMKEAVTVTEPAIAEEKTNDINLLSVVILISIILLVALIVIVILEIRSKKREKTLPETLLSPDEGNQENDKTEIKIRGDTTASQNAHFTPHSGTYLFSMTDKDASNVSYRFELKDEINIGRMSDNNIIISDDQTVHRHHCRISAKNGVFYITDLKDVKNHTLMNGIALKPEIPRLITNNSEITLGSHTYIISITEV